MLSLINEEERIQATGGQEIPDEAGPQEIKDGLGDEKSIDRNEELTNYMFFSNLKVIKEKAEMILKMDKFEIDKMLNDGHGWAVDHIATSKDDVEEVYDWISSKKENNV